MNQKLELTWIGKGEEPRLEPRILIENPDYSYGDPQSQNMLIQGDNLLALKALEQHYSGEIKCIYIDPPFNTQQAFEYYDDNREHSIWLNMMFQRLTILHSLLHKNGLLWIHLDDSEVHYCKVQLDQIFGRSNCVAHITYERSGVAGLGQGGFLVNTTEHILLYKKGQLPVRSNLGYYDLEQKTMKRYSRILVNKGSRELVREFNSKSNGLPVKVYRHSNFEIESISLKDFEKREEEIRTFFGENLSRIFRGNQVQKENAFQRDLIDGMDKSLYSVDYIPSRGKYEDTETTLYYYNQELLSWLSDTADYVDGKVVKSQKLTTLWDSEDIPKADIANEGGVYFPRSKKPENLLKRILEIATDPNDIVLDSFLGSGTTAAVAHKMNRRWIGIESGEHALSHCYPRLKSVIKGTDSSGITKSVEWKGGGGFKFYTLAPSLLNEDSFGHWVISDQYNATMLAAAMAKQEGFRYEPNPSVFWQQGQSSEKDFIYTTTQFITAEMMDKIHDQLQPDQNLLIACYAFSPGCIGRHGNISIKKIPQMLLGRCEYGKDDYSLNIVNLPTEEDESSNTPEPQNLEHITKPAAYNTTKKKVTKPGNENQLSFL